MGAAIGKMHDSAILHLDLTPGNLLLVEDGGPDWSLYFVDNNRARFGPVGFRAGIASILQCNVKGDDVSPFVVTYASSGDMIRSGGGLPMPTARAATA